MDQKKIVCYCRNVTIENIKEAVENGASDFNEVIKITGASSCCGRCRDHAKNIFEDCLQAFQKNQS